MHCLDCATNGLERVAVAICVTCGAGICIDHTRLGPLTLTRPGQGGMTYIRKPVDLPARQVRCEICNDAHAEAGRPVVPERSARRRRSRRRVNGD
jgi:hypothetical protein